MRSKLLLMAVLFTVWGLTIAVSGGYELTLFNLRISSRDPFRPCALGALCAVGYLLRRRSDEFQTVSPAHLWIATLALAGALAAATLLWGSFVAGGSDSYGYISQAQLWLNRDLPISQPWAAALPWADADWIAAPVAYRPGLEPHTIVPTYPLGFPLLIALFQLMRAPMLVVPVAAGLTVWLTYLIGRDATGHPVVGGIGALVLAASPIFLYQSMSAMADVPTAAFWALTLWLGAFRAKGSRPLLAGLSAGIALLMRPNLVLLASVLPIVWWRMRDQPWRQTVLFAAGVTPALAMIGAVNTYLYGTPWATGYGDLGALFSLVYASRNLVQYFSWTAETQSVFFLPAMVLAAILTAGWSVADRRLVVAWGVTVVATLMTYLFYQPFDAWLYLRFLLPAWPLCCCMIGALVVGCARRGRSPIETWALVAALSAPFVVPSFRKAIDLDVFEVGHSEQRYIAGARMVMEATPPNAIVIADQHSGSVRYYGDRRTLRFPYIASSLIDEGVARLSSTQPVYLFVEKWEETRFRQEFASTAAARSLDRSPVARTDDGQVTLFLLGSATAPPPGALAKEP